ncbi:MAG: type VI secretion system amidase effector protein Tae4 [Azoarcus sp.]|jgi:hypothetical protein|nr:type VI secretion system amidase effector protein Tae4 [Azoarcus sp.]
MARPSFIQAWAAFMAVNKPVQEVGDIIGGKVKVNIDLPVDQGGWRNACPVRMSYVLNKTGFPVRRLSNYKMVSGGDGSWYIYRVTDMMQYLEATFGSPNKTIKGLPKTSDFQGTKGILVIKGNGWGDASGHVTLWNGGACSDSCHLAYDPDNGFFTPTEASLWVLP